MSGRCTLFSKTTKLGPTTKPTKHPRTILKRPYEILPTPETQKNGKPPNTAATLKSAVLRLRLGSYLRHVEPPEQMPIPKKLADIKGHLRGSR